MSIRLYFACGHEMIASGAEEHPTCPCGETKILTVIAPPPRFSGHVTGPHADTDLSLPAKPVDFGVKTDAC